MRHRDFALFFTGALVSNIGMWMQNVTVPFILYQRTEQAAWLGLGAFLQFIPALLVGGVGGVFADRYPRRRILLVTQSVSMAVAGALWLVVRGGHPAPGLIAGLVAVAGIASGFGIPAWHALIPELVPPGELFEAVALNAAQFNAARAIGFVVGGVTLAVWGPGVAFAANALSYPAVLGALFLIRAGRAVAKRAGDRRSSGFKAGIVHAAGRPGVLLAVGTVAVVAFLGGPVIQLAPLFARRELGAGSSAYGLLAAALGVGATLASLGLSSFGAIVRRSRLAVGAMTTYGAAVILISLTPVYGLGLLAMFAIGVAYLVVTTVLNATVQQRVDRAYRGRVLALFGMAFTGAFPLGSLLQGTLSDLVGVRPVVGSAGLLLVAYAVWLMTRPALLGSLDLEVTGVEPSSEEAAHTAPMGRLAEAKVH